MLTYAILLNALRISCFESCIFFRKLQNAGARSIFCALAQRQPSAMSLGRILGLTAKKLGDEQVRSRSDLGLKSDPDCESLGSRIPGLGKVEDDVVTHRHPNILRGPERIRGQLRRIEPNHPAVTLRIGMRRGQPDEAVSRLVLRLVVPHRDAGKRRSHSTDRDGLWIGE
jgi:hypothetical protein